MALSKQEQDELLQKIREQYIHYADQYNEKAFDLKAFNRRYTHVFVNRGNMEAFLLAEVSFLEELKDTLENSIVKKTAVQRQLDAIGAEIEEKWQGYEKLNFHPAADEEIRFFYGAMVEFCELYLPVAVEPFRGTPEQFKLDPHVRKLEYIGRRTGGESARFRLYMNVLATERQRAEKEKQQILKDSAHSLKAFIVTLENIIHTELKGHDLTPYKNHMLKVEVPEFYAEKFSQLTAPDVVLVWQKVIEFGLGIIENFRLSAFTEASR